MTGIEAWDRVQRVNLTSVYLCCKEVIPYMQRQGKGSIVNTASFVATMAAATSQISYTASKGGVLAMSRELGVQFAREGIRVNAVFLQNGLEERIKRAFPRQKNSPAVIRYADGTPVQISNLRGASPLIPIVRSGI